MQPGFFPQQNFFNYGMNCVNPMFMYNNMMMPNMNCENNYLNMVYQSGMNNNQMNPQFFGQQQFSNQPDKVNIIFKTTQVVITQVTVDFNKSLSDTILLYLKRMNKENLFHPNSGILFLYNAAILNIYDQTKVGVLFNGITNPTIMVNDVKNLIGA